MKIRDSRNSRFRESYEHWVRRMHEYGLSANLGIVILQIDGFTCSNLFFVIGFACESEIADTRIQRCVRFGFLDSHDFDEDSRRIAGFAANRWIHRTMKNTLALVQSVLKSSSESMRITNFPNRSISNSEIGNVKEYHYLTLFEKEETVP